MSVVAKILVVINLLLAFVFLGAASTFLGEKETWKIRHTKDTADLQKKIDDLNVNLNQAVEARNEQREIANQFQVQNTELKAQLEAKELEATNISEAQDKLHADYDRLARTYTDLQGTIDQLTADKNALTDDKEKALKEKRDAVETANSAVTEQKRLEREILNLQDQLAQVEKDMNELGDKLENTNLVVALYRDTYGEIGEKLGVPLIKGAVMAVNNDLNIVLLSVGRDDNVKIGYEFTIYRGNEYVGTVIVDKVEKDHCSGASKTGIQRMAIAVGDKATTRL
jgi:predicted nuclease with TOPRIM domain